MRQISGTLLAVLITLLLGLSPLQGAIAGVSDSFDRQGDTRQITDTFDNGFTVFSDYSVTENCGQCNADDGCFSQSCPTECATCALALPPIASPLTNPVTTPGMLPTDEGVVRQLATSLYRPPKI